MPERHTGLKGYVGEWLVECWLKTVKHPGRRIVSQVRPANIDARGGPYLDFGVLADDGGALTDIYEVKTQDYRLDDKASGSPLNKGLKYLWGLLEGLDGRRFAAGTDRLVVQGGPTHKTAPGFSARLILMVPPTDVVMATYRAQASQMVYLRDVVRELRKHVGEAPLAELARERFAEDLPAVLANIERPDNWPAGR